MLAHLVSLLLLLSLGGEATPPPPAEPGHEETRLTREQVFLLALSVSSDPQWSIEAVDVAWCESRFRPDVYGDGGRAYGLLQVHGWIWGHVPPDPRGQLEQAWRIYETEGWRPWTCGRTR